MKRMIRDLWAYRGLDLSKILSCKNMLAWNVFILLQDFISFCQISVYLPFLEENKCSKEQLYRNFDPDLFPIQSEFFGVHYARLVNESDCD